LPEFNQVALAQLEAMGFPQIRCQKALLATGNSDPEAAMEWLFAHMEDPGMSFTPPTILCTQPLILTVLAVCVLDIDVPIVQTTRGGGTEPSPEQIGILADMGFSPAQARKALRETVCGLIAIDVPSF
jgi:ubiquitin carboxyl-terminal hydrolase 5/13